MTHSIEKVAERLRERLPEDGELIVATDPEGWEAEWYTDDRSRDASLQAKTLGDVLVAVLAHDAQAVGDPEAAVTEDPLPAPEPPSEANSDEDWQYTEELSEPHALCCADCKARLAEAERKLAIDPVDLMVEAIRQSAKDRPPREGTLLRFRRYAAAAVKELERHGVGLTPAEQKALLDASRAVDLGDEREQAALEAGQAKLRKSLAPADEEGELEAAG